MTSKISVMRIFRRLRPYDRFSLGYLALVLLFLAVSPQRQPAALRITIVHGLAIAIILLLVQYADRSRAMQVAHDFYPMALFTVLFSEFTHIATVLFPHWLEPLLIKFDVWAFGGSPQHWVATHLSPATSEFLAFAYWSYYLIIPGTLFLVHKKNYPHELTAATTRMCLTMYACYVMFMMSPARGPHHALASNSAMVIEGGFFTKLVHEIQKVGSVRGAAFPSSHVAVAWAMFFVLQRHYSKFAWLAGLLIAALTVSVISMGYHFSLDAIGGVVVAFGINAALDRRQDNSSSDAKKIHHGWMKVDRYDKGQKAKAKQLKT